MPRQRLIALLVAAALVQPGCATIPPPYVGQGPHPQISRGRPLPPIDLLGNILGLPAKLLLWSRKMDRHAISEGTEQAIAQYLASASELPALQDTHFRLNEYAPIDDLRRLKNNHHVAWPYRLVFGLPSVLIYDVLLPGRLFGGDKYNPFTNTVHLYSDHAAVALHETGHAHSSAEQRFKGTYSLLYRVLTVVPLYEEYIASEKAIQYYTAEQDRQGELAAYKILYPAYGTYLGSSLVPLGFIPGAIVGHAWGRSKAHSRAKYYQLIDRAAAPSSTALPVSPAPPTRSLRRNPPLSPAENPA